MKAFWKKIRFKYKLSFFNEDSLEEVWVFRLSQLSMFLSLGAFAFFLIALTAFIIIQTPIRNYLPGYLDVEVRKEIAENALRADSLERKIMAQNLYLSNVMAIFTGTVSEDSIRSIDSVMKIKSDFNIPIGNAESEFVEEFEETEKFNLSVLNTKPVNSDLLFFSKPINGVITATYDWDKKHYGIDLVAEEKSAILATLEGTVVFTGYDEQVGHVIQIQHQNGFLSLYKHNAMLLKKIGDVVQAGETIALLGNSGELSTGAHLHFELWHDGKPLNPEDYVTF